MAKKQKGAGGTSEKELGEEKDVFASGEDLGGDSDPEEVDLEDDPSDDEDSY